MKCFPLTYTSELSDKGSYKCCFFSFQKVAHTGTEKENSNKERWPRNGTRRQHTKGETLLVRSSSGQLLFSFYSLFQQTEPKHGVPGHSSTDYTRTSRHLMWGQQQWLTDRMDPNLTPSTFLPCSNQAQIPETHCCYSWSLPLHRGCWAVSRLIFSTKGQDTKNSTLDTFLLLFKKNTEWIQ